MEGTICDRLLCNDHADALPVRMDGADACNRCLKTTCENKHRCGTAKVNPYDAPKQSSAPAPAPAPAVSAALSIGAGAGTVQEAGIANRVMLKRVWHKRVPITASLETQSGLNGAPEYNSGDISAQLKVGFGLNHVNATINWRGIQFITGGAVCAKWWRGDWYGTEEGFGMLNVQGNRVTWEYVDYEWTARRPVGQ